MTIEGYIGTSAYNNEYNNTMYVGWMYGSTGNSRKYTNSAPIKRQQNLGIKRIYKIKMYNKCI